MAGGQGAELIRAFVAVTPGEDLLHRLAAAVESLKTGPQGDALRWVRPENLHVTLRFLGNIPGASAAALRGEVAAETHNLPPFTLCIGPIGLFPSPRRPRALAARLEPEAPFRDLAAAVNRGVAAAGLPGESRRFRPHLTLGRVKRNAPRSLNGLMEAVERIQPENTGGGEGSGLWRDAGPVRQVELIRSDLRPDGPVYSTLWTIPLI